MSGPGERPFRRTRLWWQEPTEDELEAEYFEEQRQEHDRILKEQSGPCPLCGEPLHIGITDYTVGRSCVNRDCLYHDFSFLHSEAEELW